MYRNIFNCVYHHFYEYVTDIDTRKVTDRLITTSFVFYLRCEENYYSAVIEKKISRLFRVYYI